MIELITVTPSERELLWNINQKYLYEMTAFYDNEMDDQGNYHYGWFDAYFTDPKRTALLIRSDGILAGFALLNQHSYFGGHPDHVMAEFTVFPAFRRRHVARSAVERIFSQFTGDWEIKYNERNAPAKALWTGVTARYSPRAARYSDDETVLLFTVGA